MIHKLVTPFTDGFGKKHAELELRDVLTAGDVLHARRAGESDQFVVGLELIARVSGLDIKDVYKLDMRDVDAIDAHIGVIRDPKAAAEPDQK